LPLGDGTVAARAILRGAVAEIPDIHADPTYQQGHFADMMDFRSIVAVPMLKDGRSLGAIVVPSSQTGSFPNTISISCALLRNRPQSRSKTCGCSRPSSSARAS
jgi:hypothetical protein